MPCAIANDLLVDSYWTACCGMLHGDFGRGSDHTVQQRTAQFMHIIHSHNNCVVCDVFAALLM